MNENTSWFCNTDSVDGLILFTTSVESRMKEHKTLKSRGLEEHKDGGYGNRCMCQLMVFATKYTQKLREVKLGGCGSWEDVAV